MKENLGSLEFSLTAEQCARLESASRIDLGFPHDFLASDEIRSLVYGGTYDEIDNHRA